MKNKLLITGGAGFIGSNIAYYFLKKGYQVTILDNFQRIGSKKNLKWLQDKFKRLRVINADIRDYNQVVQGVSGQNIIFHLAAQVAVTNSIVNPREDFETNALGTFNLIEAIRRIKDKPILIYASTNKVYGQLEDITLVEKPTRYAYQNLPYGISESRQLDFHSPYGCSKGAADQYVRDYARVYQIPSVVFRQSCIYGPRQFGVEDQGWVAWFIIASQLGNEITIYGDGKQVRDILYIDDLVELFYLATLKIKKSAGKIYNIGGGVKNSISIWLEFQPMLEKLFNKKIKAIFSNWRSGDQKVYISDIRLVERDLGWKPKTNIVTGISLLFNWVKENKNLFQE